MKKGLGQTTGLGVRVFMFPSVLWQCLQRFHTTGRVSGRVSGL